MQPIDRIKAIFRAATTQTESDQELERFDEKLTPNMRALRLAMSIADTLLSMGVSVADVVSMGLDITDRYCKRKVHFDVSSSLITASQDRGDEVEPLTMMRHAIPHGANNMMIQSIQELVRDIHSGNVMLEEAERRLDEIYQQPRTYPIWLTTAGSALISAGVGVMLSAQLIMIIIMFIAGAAVSYLMRLSAHRKIPLFFAQVFSALFITIIASGFVFASQETDIRWLDVINPNFIVVGGIVMLVAGLAIVGAVQDAIDEFYVTANARLLKVALMTIGIVAGVLLGLYFARKFGIFINVDDGTTDIAQRGQWHVLGAVIIAGGYALSNQTGKIGIIVAGLMGALALITFQAVANTNALSTIAASGIAAIVVGAAATLFSRVWRTPSTSLMTAGIVPLVPGLTLYNGLFELVGNSQSSISFNQAGGTLFTAVMIALAIASGASFGHLMARPVRRTLVRARNSLPRPKFSLRKQ